MLFQTGTLQVLSGHMCQWLCMGQHSSDARPEAYTAGRESRGATAQRRAEAEGELRSTSCEVTCSPYSQGGGFNLILMESEHKRENV